MVTTVFFAILRRSGGAQAMTVSVLVVLILERHPACTPFEIKTILRRLAAMSQRQPT